jgi:hypothetical protein
MRLAPLFEMAYRYVHRHAVELRGPGGTDGLYWMFREGTLVGERIRGSHKGMNRSTLRVDGVATGDIRGIIHTDDDAEIYYEIRAYGLAADGPRHLVGTMFFQTGDERYAWLNTTVAILEGRYTWDNDGLLIGTLRVHECQPDGASVEARVQLHEGLSPMPLTPPTPETES